MRDPDRIDSYVKRLEKMWKTIPDWRFGQFVTNLLSAVQKTSQVDTFFIEDDKMFDLMEEEIKKFTVERGVSKS